MRYIKISITLTCFIICVSGFGQNYSRIFYNEIKYQIPNSYCYGDNMFLDDSGSNAFFIRNKFLVNFDLENSHARDSISLNDIVDGLIELAWSPTGPVICSVDSNYYAPDLNKGELVFFDNNLEIINRKSFELIPSGLSILYHELDQLKFITPLDSGFVLTFGFQRRQLELRNNKLFTTQNITEVERTAWDIVTGREYNCTLMQKYSSKWKYSSNGKTVFTEADHPDVASSLGRSAFISNGSLIIGGSGDFYIFDLDRKVMTRAVLGEDQIGRASCRERV